MDCKLFVCDLDNTLLKGSSTSSWQLIWDFLGADEELRRYGWRQFMTGAFTYPDWCAHDARRFRELGLRREHFPQICAGFKPSPGLRQTLDVLLDHNVHLAIVSGALDLILETALPWHNEYFQHAFVNITRFDAGGLLKDIVPTPYDFDGKLQCVRDLCSRYGLARRHVVFVGDGINDLALAGEVGLTIAFGSDCPEIRNAFDLDLPDDDFRLILQYLQLQN